MRNTAVICGGFVVALACAAQLSAQSGQSGSQSREAHPSAVTITGCLQRADASRLPAGASADADQYVLVNAHAGSGMTAGSSGANGQSSQGTASGGTVSGSSRASNGGAARDNANRAMPYGTSGPWFIVEGDKDELRSHAGHQVEISGAIASGDGASTARGTSGAAAGPTTASGATGETDNNMASAHMGQRLRVRSMKVINPTCAE